MTKKTQTARTPRVTLVQSVALHMQAHNSDPFAGPRIALHLRKQYDQPKAVAASAQRVIDARKDGNSPFDTPKMHALKTLLAVRAGRKRGHQFLSNVKRSLAA